MSKSFFWGVVIASLTWSISLYLYWTLTNSISDNSSATNVPNDQNDMKLHRKHVINSNSINADEEFSDIDRMKLQDKSKSMLLDKYDRYKKERKNRKISNNLRMELMPKQQNEMIENDEFGMVKNSEEQFERDIGYRRHAFNVLVSNKLGMIRNIPDTRHQM